jgi:MFS family permease
MWGGMTQIQTVPSWRDVAATGQLAKFTLLCLGVWLHAADSLLAATVMPAAVAEIGGVVFINWALALYHLGSILAAVATGSVTARIGLRAGLALAALLYALGCVASATAPAIGVMLFGRLLQGLGGGGMMALVYVAIHEIFPERFWPRLLVVVSTIWGCSALCGPLIGGLFAEAGLWRWAFWAFAGQAAVVLAASAFLPGRRTGTVGGWAALPLALLVLGTIGIASAGATAGTGWAGLLGAAGLGLLYAFARLDAREHRHLLPVAALDLRRPVGNGLLMVFALSAATTPFGTYGPLLLGLLVGVGPLAAGYLVALEAIAWTLASIATSGVAARTERRLIRSGAALIAAGAFGYVLAVPAGSIAGVLACLVAQGAGFGMAWAYMVKRIVATAPEAERGRAAGSVSSVQLIGYAVGASASGIAANAAGLAAGATQAAGHAAALWLFAGFVPLGLIGAAAARRLTADLG